MDFSHPSDSLIAALVGALATVVTALIQLRISWRKELRERERGQPITKKSRRGPVLVVFALMIAAGVGGFALSQYFASLQTTSRDELRADLNAMRAELSATAARVEQSRTDERKEIETEVQRADASRMGEEGATAGVLVGPCKDCSEQSSTHVSVCASVPASATVKEVQLYIRADDKQPWADARVQPGQEAGQARFAEKYSERPEEGAKQVCQAFTNWSHEKTRVARIVVKYAL